MSFAQVTLKPTPGFCIKSTTLVPGLLPPPTTANVQPPTQASSSSGGLLEPAAQPIPVPKGMKVFINICYDKNVPAPPEAPEEVIQRAIKGAIADESVEDEGLAASGKATRQDDEEWYVPVVVSEPRVDKDKAGKPSLVVDCVYHSEVRKRTLRDPGFKVFLVELGVQRIEAQTGLTLSRNIGTPNIASKGKLEPRTVRVPTALLLNSSKGVENPLTSAQEAVADITRGGAVKGEGANALDRLLPDEGKGWDDGRKAGEEKRKKSLIEEIEPTPPKSILKKSSSTNVQSTLQKRSQPANAEQRAKEKELLIPLDVSWDWEKLDGSGRIRVTIHIPDLIASSITSQETFLDIEPRRILVTLHSPGGETRTVDINRNLSDAELAVKAKDRARLKVERVKGTGLSLGNDGASLEELEEEILAESEKEVEKLLRLKRIREFDVDGANAQWIVKDKKLVITL